MHINNYLYKGRLIISLSRYEGANGRNQDLAGSKFSSMEDRIQKFRNFHPQLFVQSLIKFSHPKISLQGEAIKTRAVIENKRAMKK